MGKRVITYGTFDLLHLGHIRLLERAKALGDYLIVGVTSDDYDMARGKINVQQSLMERIETVRQTGLADEIIVEEYEGQKIDDIKRYHIDVFTVGSDWTGKFDYLKEFCDVIYMERTKGVSSSEIRSKVRELRFALVGDAEARILMKYYTESQVVNGIEISVICVGSGMNKNHITGKVDSDVLILDDYDQALDHCDAVYILSHPSRHYEEVKKAIEKRKHVLCESPIALRKEQCVELFQLAEMKQVVLMDAIKTAYATAYCRLLLLAKSGRIGKIVSIDATCTSIKNFQKVELEHSWNSICAWGPTAVLPVFQIFGTGYQDARITSYFLDQKNLFDGFTRIVFEYSQGVASIKVGRGVKSEGELVVSGTEGYIYVPSPWWKTDYFETRFEDASENKRYFYQLDGEGIRYELLAFIEAIKTGRDSSYITKDVSEAISEITEQFYCKKNLTEIY